MVEFAILIGVDVEDLIAVLSGHLGEGWELWDFNENLKENFTTLHHTAGMD